MTKIQIRKMIGANIRFERQSRAMSIDELAEVIELTPGFIGLIERGQRGATTSTLYKISKVFNIPVDQLFVRDKKNENILSAEEDEALSPSLKLKREKISMLVSNMNDVELDFVVGTIRNIRRLRAPFEPDDQPEAD